MRKQMIENAAYEVATQVRAVEDTIDAAMSEIAELQARIMRANSVAAVGYGAVHPTLQHLASAVTGLVETRGAIVACHAELVDAKAKVPGLRTVSYGDGGDCPDNPDKIARTDLRIVA
jgi:DNA-binding FrmR family transcriptional regulator